MDIVVPDSIKFAVMDFKSDTPTMLTESDHYKKIVRPVPVHRYTCKLDTVALRRGAASRGFAAQMESLNGQAGLIRLKVPEYSYLLGNMDGTLSVRANAPIGATSIILGTTTGGVIPDALMSGTCIQFGSSTKVYSVLYDVDSLSGGDITVNLTLPLLEAITSGTVVTYHDIYFTMRQKADKRSYKISGSKKHTVSILDLEEEV